MSEPKLVCNDVWKLFGKGAERFLGHARRQNSEPTLDALADANLIPAARAVNLEIHSGEIFVIMGLSGSGKSTLLRCMSRLIEPTYGQLLFEGTDLRAASATDMINIRRHRMGMVFQHFALLPHLTVLENIAFPLDIQGQDKQARESRAREVIELVGLKGREDYMPRQLSGGQQQRVGIARSLAVEPELWFLDEPFSALDPLIRREMQDEFLRLQNKLQKTIVFITHDFDEAIRLADRIAIMKDGAIIQIATPERLVLQPADDYVAEFTRNVPRDKVITVAALMNKSESVSAAANSSMPAVRETDKVADIARLVVDADQPVSVVDEQHTQIGTINRDQILKLLLDDVSRE